MSGEGEVRWDADDQRWADVHRVADAVARHIKVRAYLLTGGSDGCAACKGLSTPERVARGGHHVECAENGIAFRAAEQVAESASDFDLCIAIAGSFDDPRMFQWVSNRDAEGKG